MLVSFWTKYFKINHCVVYKLKIHIKIHLEINTLKRIKLVFWRCIWEGSLSAIVIQGYTFKRACRYKLVTLFGFWGKYFLRYEKKFQKFFLNQANNEKLVNPFVFYMPDEARGMSKRDFLFVQFLHFLLAPFCSFVLFTHPYGSLQFLWAP